jgi:membrane associated rhomboid family serine protease
MMPLGDDNSRRMSTPVVTMVLVALNALAFMLELSQTNIEAFIRTWGAVPSRVTGGEGWETLITSMFLHGGWMHLFGNMLFLWTFGDNVEDVLGRAKYLLFYFACGIAASMAQIMMNPDSSIPAVGASGAVSGILGAYILMFGSNPVRVLLGYGVTTVPAFVMIGFWIVFQFINGIARFADTQETGGVAYAAHIGGFITGLVLGALMRGFAHKQLPGGGHPRALPR